MQRGGQNHSQAVQAPMGPEVMKRRNNWVTSPRKNREASTSLSPKAPDANNGDFTMLPEGFEALSSVTSPKGVMSSVTSPKGNFTADALPLSPKDAYKCEPVAPPLTERSSPSKGSSGKRGGSLTARGPHGGSGGIQPAPPGKTGPVSKMPPPSHDGGSSISPSSKTPRMPSNLGIAPPAPAVPGTPS